jgi:hypothetical protein
MSTFDDPAFWLNQKGHATSAARHGHLFRIAQGSRCTVLRMPYDFDADVMSLLDVASALTAIGTVGVKLFKPWRLRACLGYHSGGSVSILHARGGNGKSDDQAHRIDDEVALSTFDLLGSIEIALSTLRRGAIGLRINDSRCRLTRAPHACTPLVAQPILHLLEDACSGPTREGFIDGLPRWECGGQ